MCGFIYFKTIGISVYEFHFKFTFCFNIIFHSYGCVIFTGEGFQILTYARHAWPLNSEGSKPTVTRNMRLWCSSPRTRDTHTYCRAFGNGAVTTCLNDLGLLRLGFDHPTFRLRRERSNRLRHRLGWETCKCKIEYFMTNIALSVWNYIVIFIINRERKYKYTCICIYLKMY